MSDHLPECPRIEYIVNRHGYTLTAGSNVCMCNALRACEQRVEETWSAIAGRDQYAEGYVAGLDAAREAVAAECHHADPNEWCIYVAAIDALRGVS